MPTRKITISIPDDSTVDTSTDAVKQAVQAKAKAGPFIADRDDEYFSRRVAETSRTGPPPPPPPPLDTGLTPAPTPVLNSFAPKTGLLPTGGSGIPMRVYRKAYLNIIGHAPPPPSVSTVIGREIQNVRDGVVYTDTMVDFISFGSYRSDYIWVSPRVFRAGHSGDLQTAYKNGNQKFRVRDQYNVRGVSVWSDWAETTISWPQDSAINPADEPFMYFVDES